MLKITTPFTQLDKYASFTLGSTTKDKDGNEYIYLTGVSSTGTGYIVVYDEAYTTTLCTGTNASNMGPMALALGPCVGSGTAVYGWYQIKGKGTAYAAGAITDNTRLQTTGTAGAVDDGTGAGSVIVGLWCRETVGGSGSLFKCQIHYPKNIKVDLT
jgi:hypothetical protein